MTWVRNSCPFCGAGPDLITLAYTHAVEGSYSEAKKCLNCDRSWQEVYELHHAEEIEPGSMFDPVSLNADPIPFEA